MSFSTPTRVLEVGLSGLELVLGGDLRLLALVPGAGESATLLVRGPSCNGKRQPLQP